MGENRIGMERTSEHARYHVVRGERYACAAKRDPSKSHHSMSADLVSHGARCDRIGCANDYAKADREGKEEARS